MYKRVLIPLDGSRLAEGILPFILEIARPLDLEVVLLRDADAATFERDGPARDSDRPGRGAVGRVAIAHEGRHPGACRPSEAAFGREAQAGRR